MTVKQAPPPGGPLSDAELRQMIMLLARYANYELDQWELWKIATEYSPVFVTIMNAVPEKADPEAFLPIWPLPERLRSAQGTKPARDDP
jgi:hypothetical protein